jgi:3-methyl-2-oxobutanoate hydroxymethyltransferase
MERAQELAAAGAAILVLEMVPVAVAREVTAKLSIPTIGIGAGAGCSGQVLVLHDMLGLTVKNPPRFVRNFLEETGVIDKAIQAYVQDVKSGRFPVDELHGY